MIEEFRQVLKSLFFRDQKIVKVLHFHRMVSAPYAKFSHKQYKQMDMATVPIKLYLQRTAHTPGLKREA